MFSGSLWKQSLLSQSFSGMGFSSLSSFLCCVALVYTKKPNCSLCKSHVPHCPCRVSTLCWGAGCPGVGRCFIGFPLGISAKLGFTPCPSQGAAGCEDLAQAHPWLDVITPTVLVLHPHCAPGTIPVKAACSKCHWCYLAFLASPLQLSPPSILQPEQLLDSTVLFLAYSCRM